MRSCEYPPSLSRTPSIIPPPIPCSAPLNQATRPSADQLPKVRLALCSPWSPPIPSPAAGRIPSPKEPWGQRGQYRLTQPSLTGFPGAEIGETLVTLDPWTLAEEPKWTQHPKVLSKLQASEHTGSLGQWQREEDLFEEFQASLGYSERPCLKK